MHTRSTSTQAAPLSHRPTCPTAPQTWHVPNPFFLLCPLIWLTEPLPHKSPAATLEAILSVPIPALPYGPSNSSSAPLPPWDLVTCFLDSGRWFGNFSIPPYLTPLIHCPHCHEINLLTTLVRLALEKSQTLPHTRSNPCPPPQPDKTTHLHSSPRFQCSYAAFSPSDTFILLLQALARSLS